MVPALFRNNSTMTKSSALKQLVNKCRSSPSRLKPADVQMFSPPATKCHSSYLWQWIHQQGSQTKRWDVLTTGDGVPNEQRLPCYTLTSMSLDVTVHNQCTFESTFFVSHRQPEGHWPRALFVFLLQVIILSRVQFVLQAANLRWQWRFGF